MPFSIYNPYSTDLFEDKPYSFDYDKAIKELEAKELAEKEAQAKRDAEAQRKMEQKAFRREQWALAIPAITAALVASDTSEITRALANYSELVSASMSRRQAAKEAGLERTHEVSQEQARQQAAREAQREGFGFQANQNELSRELTRGEGEKNREFEFEKMRLQDEQRMKELGYDRDTRIVLSNMSTNAAREQLRLGVQLDRETTAIEVARNIQMELEQQVIPGENGVGGISSDIARSLAEKLATGAPLSSFTDEERAVNQLWIRNRKEESQDKKELNALGTVMEYMRIPKETGQLDINGNPITVPRTKEDALQAFPSLGRIFATPSARDAKGSDGLNPAEREQTQDYLRGKDYVLRNPQVQQVFSSINEEYKSESSRGLAEQKAVRAAIKLSEDNTTDSTMGVIDTLNIDPNLKMLMRDTVRQQQQTQQPTSTPNPIMSAIQEAGGFQQALGIAGQPETEEEKRRRIYQGLGSGGRRY